MINTIILLVVCYLSYGDGSAIFVHFTYELIVEINYKSISSIAYAA